MKALDGNVRFYLVLLFAYKSPSVKGTDETSSRPNILFIMADQLRYDAARSSSAHSTPNLDALRSEGVSFRNAFSSTPTCTPARAAILTGCSPWNHGLLGYGIMANEYPTELPKILSDSAGYESVVIGKNHYGGTNVSRGFQHQHLYEGLPEIFDDYDSWFQSLKPDQDPLATGIGWNDWQGRPYVYEEYYHPTAWVGRQADDFLRHYESEKPFFLKVSFHRPHSPYDPPQRFLDLVNQSVLPPITTGCGWDDAYSHGIECGGNDAWCGKFPSSDSDQSRTSYLANVVMIDEWVGRIIKVLTAKHPNTFVLLTSDHGDMQGDHNLWRKGYPYQGSTHLPMIIRWPQDMAVGVSRGAIVSNVVELRDVLPTLWEVATGSSKQFQCGGESLLSLLRDPHHNWRSYIDLEHDVVYNSTIHWNALTDGRYKYIYRAFYGDEQLFHLEKDPVECQNLVHVEAYESVLKTWRRRLIHQFETEERGPEWVRNGTLQQRQTSTRYSPHYPSPTIYLSTS